MVFINEISDTTNLERLRGEILSNVGSRADQETSAMNRLATFMGIICSGSTIAILGFIGQQVKSGVPVLALVALCFFMASALTLAGCLYWQYQIHSRRWADYAEVAQRFFMRQAELEDVLNVGGWHQSLWPSRLLFWLPASCLLIGLALSVIAVAIDRPRATNPSDCRDAALHRLDLPRRGYLQCGEK